MHNTRKCFHCKQETLGYLHIQHAKGLAVRRVRVSDGVAVIRIPYLHHVKVFCSEVCQELYCRSENVFERHRPSPGQGLDRLVRYMETAKRAVGLNPGGDSEAGRVRKQAAGN